MKIKKVMTITEILLENDENHEKHRIPCENHENHEYHRISCENHEHHKKS